MSNSDPIDRCGIGIFSTDPKKDPFTQLCRWHDNQYINLGGSSDWVRKSIDHQFLTYGLNIAKQRGSKWLALKARAYYAIVRAVGWIYWD